MQAESGLLFPYFQSSPPHVQRFEDFYRFQKRSASMSYLVEPSSMSDYGMGREGDLFKAPEPIMEELATDVDPMMVDYGIGREGDLFKAPEPIMEEPVTDVDPMIAALSMISCGEEGISPHSLEVAESIQNEELLRDIFYECEKDLLAKAAIETAQSGVLEGNLSCSTMGEPVQKSISSGCLSSIDPGSVYGMRRAFSEGDIKTLGNGQVNIIHEWQKCDSEERMQKLSRYRNKKKNRNFGRKIKYACRKALADSQPRIRGRFAKTEEPELPRKRRG